MQRTLGARAYTDFHQDELDSVFAHTWFYVGKTADIQKSNWVTPVEAFSRPLIIVSDKNNKLSAFYNVCQHRGGPLALKPGKARQLQCLYHGWCYSHDGVLTHATKMDELPEVAHLKKAYVDVWEDMVFVCSEKPWTELSQQFVGIAERIAPYHLASLKAFRSVHYEVKANWKIYVDNYLEGYHVPYLHPKLNGSYSGVDYTTVVLGHQSLQHSTFATDDQVYGHRGRDAFYYHVYPNIMLNILPDRLQINQIVPIDADRCRVEFYYFYAKELSADDPYIVNDQKFSDEVQSEDIEVCEHLQKAMRTGAYTSGVYHPTEEVALAAFHQMLRQSVPSLT